MSVMKRQPTDAEILRMAEDALEIEPGSLKVVCSAPIHQIPQKKINYFFSGESVVAATIVTAVAIALLIWYV